ncbi:hypothetical protein J6590_061761 [Homalodisca vitripennis]|nr:hypothetical protein J6590_061761 [Homalodisca vitripennis]
MKQFVFYPILLELSCLGGGREVRKGRGVCGDRGGVESAMIANRSPDTVMLWFPPGRDCDDCPCTTTTPDSHFHSLPLSTLSFRCPLPDLSLSLSLSLTTTHQLPPVHWVFPPT